VNVLAAADAERSAGLSLATPVSHIKAEVVGWTRPDQSLRWTIEVPTRDAYAVSVLIGQRSGQAVELRVSADGASVTSGFRPDPRGSVDPHHVFRRRADRVQGLPALAEAIFRPFQELEARLLDPPADGPWKTPVLDRSAAEGLPGALGFGVVLPADQGALGVGV